MVTGGKGWDLSIDGTGLTPRYAHLRNSHATALLISKRIRPDHLNRLGAERIRANTGSWPTWAYETTQQTGDIFYDTTPGYGDSSGYDRVGNRRSRTASGVPNVSTTSYATYDADDRLGGTLATGTSASTFDPNGNTLRFNLDGDSNWDNTQSDDYDFQNRLITRHTTINSQPSTINIVYDGDGNRGSKTAGTTKTQYLVDDLNPTGYPQVLAELDGDSHILVTYVYGLGPAPISQTRYDSYVALPPNYYGCDDHGSVRFLTDSSGNITDTYNYDAFGILIGSSTINNQTATLNNYLYTGQQWDSDLSEYYLRARYYNPDEGRFWTMDGFEGDNEEPASLHKYNYCANDAANNTDPTGHEIEGLAASESGYSMLDMLRIALAMSRSAASYSGGPDVTGILKRTLNDVSATFATWHGDDRERAESLIGGPLAGNAWEIVELHAVNPPVVNTLDFGTKHYNCGWGRFQGTVAVSGNCYYADAVNYAIFGRMFKLCHDDFVAKHQWLTAADYSLAGAEARAAAFKVGFHLDITEHTSEALAFVEYGYTGNLPNSGLPCAPSNETVSEPLFEWVWEPTKPH